MESEGCWEVITCRPYEHHVSLGCSQTCLSFPLWTDLTPAVTWRGIHSVWSLRSFFFLNIYKIIPWIVNLNEFLASPFISDARTNRKPDFLTMHGDNEIQRSSATNTTQNLPISRPLFISITSPPALSSWVGARRTLIWHQPPSVTNLNCCVMNYKAGAGAVELFCVTNIPPESAGYSDRWMGGDCWQKVCIWCHLQSVCMNGN